MFAKGNTHIYCILNKPCHHRPPITSSSPTTTNTASASDGFQSSIVLIYKLSSQTNTTPTNHKPIRLALPSYISSPNHIEKNTTPPLPHLYDPHILTATMAISKDANIEFDMTDKSRVLSQIIHLVPFTSSLMKATQFSAFDVGLRSEKWFWQAPPPPSSYQQ